MSSRRDLAALVEKGAFRDDFFYRIDVVSIRLPRLRDRREDILPLAREFLRRAARAYVAAGAPLHAGGGGDARCATLAGQRARARCTSSRRRCLARNLQRSARAICRPDALGLPGVAACSRRSKTAGRLKQLTDAYITETLRRAGGNRSLAAKRLGVSRKFLWERGKK